jgi:hypothetical protein
VEVACVATVYSKKNENLPVVRRIVKALSKTYKKTSSVEGEHEGQGSMRAVTEMGKSTNVRRCVVYAVDKRVIKCVEKIKYVESWFVTMLITKSSRLYVVHSSDGIFHEHAPRRSL